jgi:type II secretory ATPase GspE/PulE/Tfp pilus assembly ATPase PilB-like protein
MLVGEIRDRETADIAVKASITGHLVLSTLHTNSAPATVTRLTHMGLPPFLAAASVKLIVAQRLLKVFCPACRRASALTDDERAQLREEEAAKLVKLCRSAGCPACNQTGFSGRKAVYEVMPVATACMRQAILTGQDADALTRLAIEEGMTTLRQSALNAVAAEETSLDEAFKVMFAE